MGGYLHGVQSAEYLSYGLVRMRLLPTVPLLVLTGRRYGSG
jgi:hypothetical protein